MEENGIPLEQPVNEGQKPPEGSKPDDKGLGQFKTPEDLLKAYKEIQGAFTKVTQENKTYQEQLRQINEQMQLSRIGTPPPQQQEPTDFDTLFIRNPQQAIQAVVGQQIRTQTIQEVLVEEETKNPAEFRERYNYAMAARQMYPQLTNSSAGVRKLFEVGDKMRKEDLKRNADRALREVFGEDLDYEKFKTLVKKDQTPSNNQNLAYMPDTSGAFRTGTEPGKPTTYDQAINEAVQKGDERAVIKNIFDKALKT